MSKVADFIDKVFGTIPIISDILHLFGKFIDTELEFIMGLFGIEAKDVISTSLTSQRILEDATVAKLVTKCAIEEKREPNEGILTRLMAYSQTARGMYRKYYNYGENTFVDGLPETNIRSLVVDEEVIKSVIDDEYGIDCTIIESRLGSVTKEVFVSFMLQEDYGYTPYNNSMIYNGYLYKVSIIDYNYDTDQYDVTIRSFENQTTTTTITTTVVVTNIDATTDNKKTTVTKRIELVGDVQGLVSDTTEVLSVVDEVVPIGTAVDSESSVVDIVTVNDVIWSTVVLHTVAYRATRYYTVKYWYSNIDEWYYWVYENGSGGYPVIDTLSKYISNLEMLPIITIRNATKNINEDTESERYKQSKAILSFIGLDIDTVTESISANPSIDNVEDCLVHFGLRPQDKSKVVSKALYNMFDFLYDSGLNSEGSYIATFDESPFNAALKWSSQSRTAVSGVIGKLNYTTHTTNGTTLTIRKQVAPEQYVEIVVTDLAIASFIDRAGMVGTVEIPLNNDNFSIPLSYYFISKLSVFDQYELFNKTLLITLYSAQVTHLEWYETPEFGSLLKIIGIVLTVVTFGASAMAYGLVAAIAITAIGMVIVIGATMLLKMIMRSTDNKFIQGLAMVLYVAAMVYGTGFGMPLDASQLVRMVTYFGTAMSSAATAIGTYTEIQGAKLGTEKSIYEQKLKTAFEEVESRRDEFSSMFTVKEVTDMTTANSVSPYLYGVDAMMYRAINSQYAYDVMFDYDALVGEYYTRTKMLGIV